MSSNDFLDIFTRQAVWVFIVHRILHSWGGVFILVNLGDYFIITKCYLYWSETCDVRWYPFIPTFLCLLLSPIIDYIYDWVRLNHKIRKSNFHKLIICSAYFLECVGFLLLFLINDFAIALILCCVVRLIILIGDKSIGDIPGDTFKNDIWSKFILNMVTAIIYFVVFLADLLITINYVVEKKDRDAWKMYILGLCVLSIIGCLLFLVQTLTSWPPWEGDFVPDNKKTPINRPKPENRHHQRIDITGLPNIG